MRVAAVKGIGVQLQDVRFKELSVSGTVWRLRRCRSSTKTRRGSGSGKGEEEAKDVADDDQCNEPDALNSER